MNSLTNHFLFRLQTNMKITFLKPIFNIFKRKYPTITQPCKLGYSDLPSQQIRNTLRKNILNAVMPYDEFYKEGRKSEYELNKMISNLRKTSNVNDEKLKDLKIWNFSKVQKNAYRGQSLDEKLEYLKTLKEAGIKTIIDLSGHASTERACKETGLEYKEFIIDDEFWNQAVFQNEKLFLSDKEDYLRTRCSDKKLADELKRHRNEYHQNCKNFINNFTDFITTINKDHFYIGCDLGTDKTDDILMLSKWLNPKDKQFASKNPSAKIVYIESLYKNLTEADKQQLGYTPEFEEKLKRNIDLIKNL